MLQLANEISRRSRAQNHLLGSNGEPTTWNPYLLSGYGNDSNVTVTPKKSLQLSAVYRAVVLLMGSIAGSPRHVFRRLDGGGKQVDREHAAQRLIYSRPNPYQNHLQYHQLMVPYMELWGNFYSFIVRNRFYEPEQLIPLPPWLVTPETKAGRKVYRVETRQEIKYIDDANMIHTYNLSLDGLEGITPIQYLAQTTGLSLVAEKFQASAYGKGINAGGIMTLPEDMRGLLTDSDEESQQAIHELRKSFEDTYSKPANFQKLMILEPGMDFKQFQMNFETAQLLQTRKFQISEIARMFGLPMHKLMNLEDVKYNTIEQQGIEYVQDGVMPRTNAIEAEYNAKLLTEDEQDTHFIKFNLDGLMRADIKTRYEAYATALGAKSQAWMTYDEVRDLEDLGPADETKLRRPKNMVPNDYEED